MKKYRILICLFLVIVLALSLCILYPPLAARIYFGDRIKGTLEVIVDGEPFVLSKDNFDVGDNVKLEGAQNGALSLSLRAGDYGDYPINLNGVYADRVITIHCSQHNWWNIMTFSLTIKINTAKNEAIYSGSVTTRDDDGKKQTESIFGTQAFSDEALEISFGV